MDNTIRFRALALVVVALAFFSSAERCGPATGLLPAYAPKGVVADDSIVGDYVTLDDKPVKGNIKRADTPDGPSYLMTFPEGKERARFRIFLLDINGQRFADVIAEPFREEKNDFAAAFSVPLHIYCRVFATGSGFALDYIDAKWFDEELAKDPKMIATVTPVSYQRSDNDAKRETFI